jgi:hypothetical protein
MLLAGLHPAAPPDLPHSSVEVWVAVAVVLAVIVLGGLVVASRR